jgi:hypothetical protein
MELNPLVQKLGVLSKNLASASSIRERVRISDRIFDVLGEIEAQVERFVVSELGQQKKPEARPVSAEVSKDRFRGMPIAQAGKILLKEHGQLHGKEIERLLKSGGIQSKAEHFQSTMLVAFGRDGGFKNIGGNTWRLKTMSEPANGVPVSAD